jgi:hypothetical protein
MHPTMTTRLLLALFFAFTILGTTALSMTGCDDDPGTMTDPDLSVLPDLRPVG